MSFFGVPKRKAAQHFFGGGGVLGEALAMKDPKC